LNILQIDISLPENDLTIWMRIQIKLSHYICFLNYIHYQEILHRNIFSSHHNSIKVARRVSSIWRYAINHNLKTNLSIYVYLQIWQLNLIETNHHGKTLTLPMHTKFCFSSNVFPWNNETQSTSTLGPTPPGIPL